METNEIRKQVLLKAPLARVWRALTQSNEFGAWFGMKLEGPFVVSEAVRGVIVPTSVDPEVAKMQKPYEGAPVVLLIEAIEPEHRFSFRWHPDPVEPNKDYRGQPTTLVTFTLEEKAGVVLLTVTESGFEGIPLTRRADLLKSNEGGWEKQMELISKYLARGK
jgi:uncharacterized protein YndB with AHSA1/START domain